MMAEVSTYDLSAGRGAYATPSQKRMADEVVDATVQKNTISTLVSRELRLAHGMITHAGVGVFP
jgi:hypothetical protein